MSCPPPPLLQKPGNCGQILCEAVIATQHATPARENKVTLPKINTFPSSADTLALSWRARPTHELCLTGMLSFPSHLYLMTLPVSVAVGQRVDVALCGASGARQHVAKHRQLDVLFPLAVSN